MSTATGLCWEFCLVLILVLGLALSQHWRRYLGSRLPARWQTVMHIDVAVALGVDLGCCMLACGYVGIASGTGRHPERPYVIVALILLTVETARARLTLRTPV